MVVTVKMSVSDSDTINIYTQGLIGGGGVDGVASHPPFICSFVHIGVGLSLLASAATPHS